MTPERRRQLEQRRRELQQRLRREERRALLTFATEELDRLHVDYEVVFETEPLVRWLEDRFPIGHHTIDWARVPDHRCWPDEDVVPRALVAQVADDSEAPVEVLYGNGRYPALRLRLATALAHIGTLSAYFEVWMLCRSRGWIIEYVSAKAWCWGRAS